MSRGRGLDLDIERSHTVGRLGITIAIVCLVNLCTIILMYTVASFFGPLNDLGVAIEGILLATLAWQLHVVAREKSNALGLIAVIAAMVGAGVVVAGSALVIGGVTGWFFAGQITMFGYAVLGCWMVVVNHLAQRGGVWPQGLTQFGVLIGVIMLGGLFATPAIVRHLHTQAQAPWYVTVAYAGGVGWFLLLPIWSLRLSRMALAGRLGVPSARTE